MLEKFRKVFKNDNVVEAYKLISEYHVWVEHSQIESQKIGIKIYKDLKGLYSYVLSHHYHGSKQAAPYVSSHDGGFQDEVGALKGAKQEIFSFYDPDDSNAGWVPSSYY